MKFHVLLYYLSVMYYAEAYKFLLVFPLPVKSLNNLGEGCAKQLLRAGHEVTFITVFPIKDMTNDKFHQIDISDNLKIFEGENILNIASVMNGEIPQKDLHMLRKFGLDSAKATIKNVAMRNFLEDRTQKFEAVIADFYEIEIYAGLAALFDCPMIWSYSMGAHSVILRLIDENPNPAYVADYLSTNVPPLTYMQRLEELWAQAKWNSIKTFYTKPAEETLYRQAFEPFFEQRGKLMPEYEKLIYNASLVLSNDHIAAGNVPKTPANFIFVGGQHIARPTKALPQALQTLMDRSKNGVIYFSLGSTWQSKDIPKQIIEELLNVFSELKQTVIWKFEADLKDLPKNVHILKWAPQQSILDHPNCLIFISHGGLLSSLEAVHFGVPVIGVPIYLDQFVNINKAVSQGYALKIDLNMKLAEQIKKATKMMLDDQSYAQRVKELSMVYHDRPVSAGAELVHWVEHVVRTRGAPHLRSPALAVPLYQKMYLDLLVPILLLFLCIFFAIKSIFPSAPSKKSLLKGRPSRIKFM